MARGSCLCGAVTFETGAFLGDGVVCHCRECRTWSGHAWAAVGTDPAGFRLLRQDGLRWMRVSPRARRGYCAGCGTSLFWDPDGENRIDVALGALDMPTGRRVQRHLFAAEAGDYYTPEGPPPPPSGPAPERLACRCLCGAVAFTLPGPAGPVTACHCGQCRKTSGHYAASFDAEEARVDWQSRDGLAEYETPAGGRRGFCTGCGSSIYFRAADGAFSVEAGAVQGPTGGTLAAHIFAEGKGDWYDLTDGLPQHGGAG